MVTTVRVPEALRAEALRYAGSVGLSFNALVGVALRAYLDAHPCPESLPVVDGKLTRQQRRALDRAQKKGK